MDPLKVLLVDDHPDFLETLVFYLAKFTTVRIVAKIRSGEEAVKRVQAKPPDLVLMDVLLPGMNGFEATRRVKAFLRPPRVIILTLLSDPESRALAEEAGADGFLGKAEITSKLLPKIATLFPDRTLS